MEQFLSRISATLPHDPGSSADAPHRHLGWLLLALYGIGATIGAGIFVMPGTIATLAGPAGIYSFMIVGVYFCAVGYCYQRFSVVVPNGVSAYSYTYHTLGELWAWIVGWGLFIEYVFGTAAVAIGFSAYVKTACNLSWLPQFWRGPTEAHSGIDIIAIACVGAVTLLITLVGTHKPAWINAIMVSLKLVLLSMFVVAGATTLNIHNWQPFLPRGWEGVMHGAALAVFPFVGFDALYTFARESKSLRDTKVATYVCVFGVAALYMLVFLVMTGLATSFIVDSSGSLVANPLLSGDESAAPLAKVMVATGHPWVATSIAIGAIAGLFNVVFVMLQGAPRIFRNMAEDGLLWRIFRNLIAGTIFTGIFCALLAGFVPFEKISELMVLGTLVAFLSVGIGILRLQNLKFGDYLAAAIVIVGSAVLMVYLNPLVLWLYFISCPVGLLIYFGYGYWHSNLGKK